MLSLLAAFPQETQRAARTRKTAKEAKEKREAFARERKESLEASASEAGVTVAEFERATQVVAAHKAEAKELRAAKRRARRRQVQS